MANVLAIHSAADSIMTFLRNTYPQEIAGRPAPDCTFDLVSSGELAGDLAETSRVTLYLYRITINEHGRHGRPGGHAADARPPLGLDLHFLLTAWAGNARDEHVMLAWTMRQLHLFPVLDASSLNPNAGWTPAEIVHVVPAELSTEDVMRIWDALEPPYRLSVSYIARVVRIDPDAQAGAPPVVATRFAYGTEAAE